jgi:ankyrin repeat protein
MLWKEAAKNELGTQRALTHFIKTNNLAGLALFLELGANVEARLPAFDMSHLNDSRRRYDRSEFEPIPLLIVVDLDHVLLAHLLLEKGAEVEYFDGNGEGKFSPLHAAHSTEMVQLLLDYNADPEHEDENAYGPLDWYVMRDNIEPMRVILEHGADPNKDSSHFPPIYKAVKSSLAAVKLLVEYGARVDKEGVPGNTPLLWAAVMGKTDVVKFLLERWPEGARKECSRQGTPLHMAARLGHIEVVRLLVEIWPEGKEAVNSRGKTPLSWLVNREHPSREWIGKRDQMIALLACKEADNH